MLESASPTKILRQAWDSRRLDELRAAVTTTIAGLEAMPSSPAQSLASPPANSSEAARHTALLAVSEELREATGMAINLDAVVLQLRPGDPAWRQSFDRAVSEYRAEATASLLRALSEP